MHVMLLEERSGEKRGRKTSIYYRMAMTGTEGEGQFLNLGRERGGVTRTTDTETSFPA